MSQACLTQPDVPSLAEATRADSPGERALDARPFRVESDELVRVLPLARGLERLVLLLGPDCEGPPGIPLARTEAVGTTRAGATILHRELDLDDGAVAIVDGRGPTDGDCPKVSKDRDSAH